MRRAISPVCLLAFSVASAEEAVKPTQVQLPNSDPSPSNETSPVFIDTEHLLPWAMNLVNIPYDDITTAFRTPASRNDVPIPGYDWTKPFPGVPIDGHAAYVTVAHDVPVPAQYAENATTALSSIAFSLPGSMAADRMDPSWHICQSIYVSKSAYAREITADYNGCGFISDECKHDIEFGLSHNWPIGKDPDAFEYRCEMSLFSRLPASCASSLGELRPLPFSYNSADLKDEQFADALTKNQQSQYTIRIGSGYRPPGDRNAYTDASDRTYLIATTWGYARDIDASQKSPPNVTLACVRPVRGRYEYKAGGPTTEQSSGARGRYAAIRLPRFW